MNAFRTVKSEIISFHELPESQQIEWSELDNDCFVQNPRYKGEYLPLSMFLRVSDCGRWQGIYGTSYFSAYGIILSKDGTGAIVGYISR
jgi:hypothetical protein